LAEALDSTIQTLQNGTGLDPGQDSGQDSDSLPSSDAQTQASIISRQFSTLLAERDGQFGRAAIQRLRQALNLLA
jgi:hypothetical protein